MKTYWQGEIYGEIYGGCELVDIDFPRRETAEEALADAVSAVGLRDDRDRCIPGAAEWRETKDGVEATGNCR